MVPSLISSLFPTAIRQGGYAFPYSIGPALFTGLTPLVQAWLVREHGLMASMAQYPIACAVVLAVAVSVRFMPQDLGVETKADGLLFHSTAQSEF